MKKILFLIAVLLMVGNVYADESGGVITKPFFFELDSVGYGDTDYGFEYFGPIDISPFVFIDDSATGSGATPDSNVWISFNYAFNGVVIDGDSALRTQPNCAVKAFMSSISEPLKKSSGFAQQQWGKGPVSSVFFADTATATFSVTVDDSDALDQDGRLNTRLVDDNAIFGLPHYLYFRLTPTWTAGEFQRKMYIYGVIQGIDRRRYKP